MSAGAKAPADDRVADFVARFESTWAQPTAEGLADLIHPDGELVQPLLPPMRGREEVRQGFAGLLQAMPDLRAQVHASGGTPDRMFIEFTLRGTMDGSTREWQVVDCFTLEDGVARQRTSYFDPAGRID